MFICLHRSLAFLTIENHDIVNSVNFIFLQFTSDGYDFTGPMEHVSLFVNS